MNDQLFYLYFLYQKENRLAITLFLYQQINNKTSDSIMAIKKKGKVKDKFIEVFQ